MSNQIDVGPVGAQVAKNIRTARSANGLQYKQVSEMLANIGRPIPPLGLRRIEKLERRVDVQDLAAFAELFSFTVEQLMFSDFQVTATA